MMPEAYLEIRISSDDIHNQIKQVKSFSSTTICMTGFQIFYSLLNICIKILSMLQEKVFYLCIHYCFDSFSHMHTSHTVKFPFGKG